MKPALENLKKSNEESFVVKWFDYHYFPTPWHYHPEYELVLVTKSTGKRFIGDNVVDFSAGDLAFIGKNLPHLYKNDLIYYAEKQSFRAQSIVVHFSEDSFGKGFFNLPEMHYVKLLLNESARGYNITGDTNTKVSKLLYDMLDINGNKRLILFLQILELLANDVEKQYISNNSIEGQNTKEASRLNVVIEYVTKNFHSEIRGDDVANLVNMNKTSFSRYFSSRTRKAFSVFLTEIRLNHACKLLIETQLSISEIGQKSGFKNLSNFNRLFKKTYSTSPLLYRNRLIVIRVKENN